MKKKMPEDDIITNLYKKGKSCREIGELLNISPSYASKIIKLYGISRKCGNIKKYKYNNSYFENIDTEEKAYILGYLYADGCVYYRKKGNHEEKSLSLKCSKNDKEILEFIIKELKSNHKISEDSNGYIGFKIYDNKIFDDLVKHGCIPNKTCKLKFPTFLREDLIRHFIRGYFDGDGCICYQKFCLESNEEFLIELQKHLPVNSKTIPKRTRNGLSYNLTIGGIIQIKKIYNYIYKDAIIVLHRKHDKFVKELNSKIQRA